MVGVFLILYLKNYVVFFTELHDNIINAEFMFGSFSAFAIGTPLCWVEWT